MSKRVQQKPEIVVISDDEDEPKAKKMEKEPRAPPAEVVELKEKVAKLEKDLEGALRYARQYELEKEEKQQRVEFLENLLDQKPVVDGTDKKLIDELQNKLAEVSNHLEEANKSAAIKEKEQWKKVKSLAESSEAEKQEAASREGNLQKGLDAITKKLHEERALATEDRKRDRAWQSDLSSHLKEAASKEERAAVKELEAAQEINALKLEIVALKRTICSMHDNGSDLHERVSALSKELEEEQQRAREEPAISKELEEVNRKAACREMELQKRIDELSDKVAKYELVLQQVQQVVQPPPMLITPVGSAVTTTDANCGLQESPDKKPVFLAGGTDKKLVKELQNKLTETSKQLEEANRKAACREMELQERVSSPTAPLETQQTQYEEVLQQLQKAVPPPAKGSDVTTSEGIYDSLLEKIQHVHQKGPPTNCFGLSAADILVEHQEAGADINANQQQPSVEDLSSGFGISYETRQLLLGKRRGPF